MLEGCVFLRGRQHRKKNKIPAIASAARTPTITPAIAPPESDELLLALVLVFAAMGVVVAELVFVAAVVVAALADV
jgi:hypothetical protein